jgi:hypothetical protein
MGYGREGSVRYPIRAKDFSLIHSDQIDSGAHPASCIVSAEGGGSFPGGKVAEA